jgi:hypothetical protein
MNLQETPRFDGLPLPCKNCEAVELSRCAPSQKPSTSLGKVRSYSDPDVSGCGV